MNIHFFFSLICLAVALCANAQESNTTATLYSYGKPLDTCEANFENLFANVPKFLHDGDSFDLLSFRYVGVVKNVRHARKLVKRNFKNLPSWSYGTTSGRDSDGEVKYEKTTLILEWEFPALFNKKEMIKTISNEYVHTGDKIYLLRFVYDFRTIEQYIFVHADTKEMVTEGNPFGFDIPLSYFEYFDK